MTTLSVVTGWSIVLCCTSFAAHAAPVEAPPAAPAKTVVQGCEDAVTASIQKSRGPKAKTVQFGAPATASADSVQGAGRYQGAAGTMPFTYSCTLDAQTHSTTGVIFKDTGEPVRAAEKPWQADLTNISPEVCQAAVAAAVVEKYPRAVNVGLSSQSRQLKPAPNGHTYLLGQGNLQRAAGMAVAGFTYRCELDTSSGKLLGVQAELVP